MIKGLGHLIRFMFGGKRPLSASAVHMVGARHHDLVEAPAASVDLLRRAMEAATQSPPEAERERVAYAPAPEETPQDTDHALPTLFLHGVTALSQELKPQEVAPEPEEIAEPEPVAEVWAIVEMAEVEELPEPVSLAVEAPEEPVAEEILPQADIIAEPELESLQEDMALPQEAPDESPDEEMISVDPEPEAVAAQAKSPAKKRSPAKKKAATPKRKKSAAEDLPSPADEVFLSDAVIWSQCGSWREFWLPPTDANSSQRIDEFRNMAAEGKLTIWGQTEGASNWSAIDPAHWKKNGFDPLSFLAGRENVYSEARPAKSKAKTPPPPVRYSSLKVSKAEVEALWKSDAAQAAA